ncbi:D-galactose 1-dehydrogenase [Kitasatospora sp. MMS16-BH015]|uniref:Gfo/Idh/MocA family protein n=1 Tax=Kitasatospora sp. MMS16-BH015 TaxID=2018025 RepID=UPI000CA39BDA|nr:Gfo/Idh/MocA family oxidoreductase [Kitasatospora sp. MMS16-BH015]AUG80402.1 D-galactose 1-dehydrogenase [Kitasatospora sp. MMS16-BH015]
MRIGIIGLGVIAPYFLRAIDQDGELTLTAACDLDTAKLAELTPGVPHFTDYLELLGSGLVDGVVITLPNHLHAPVVTAALAAGVHVTCEKPLTVHSSEARELAAVATQAGSTLFTAFHRRYNSHVRRLAAELPPREQIEKVVGRYHEKIEEHTGDDRWYLDRDRCGGGCVIDNGPNALDALRQVVGELTLTDATLGDVRAGVEFYAELELRTEDGIPVEVQLDWALPGGEIKDIVVHLKDGTTVTADMLAGYHGFKSSLDHEYQGIMADFRAAVAAGPTRVDDGPVVVDLVEQAYRIGRSKERRLRMPAKADASARLVKLLFHRRQDRGMTLSPWSTRCVRAGELHELVTTTELPRLAGDRVDAVGFLGFAEFESGTVIGAGDQLWFGERLVGTVVGFDECHHPNHYNILIHADRLLTAEDLDLAVGDRLVLKESPA